MTDTYVRAPRLNWSNVLGSDVQEAQLSIYRLRVRPLRSSKAQWGVYLVDDWSQERARGTSSNASEAKREAEQALAQLLDWDHL